MKQVKTRTAQLKAQQLDITVIMVCQRTWRHNKHSSL